MPHDHKLTIAIICADISPGRLGGAEHHIIEVAKRLAKKHRLIFFVGADTSIKKVLPKSVQAYPVFYPQIPNFFGIFYILFGFPQILRQLNHIGNPDVIWAKQSYPQAILAARLKRKLNSPLYITAQNPALLYEELVTKGSLLKPLHQTFANLLNPFIKWAYLQSDLTAAVSRYSEKLAKQYGAKQTVIVPNGVNLPPQNNLRSKNQEPRTVKIFSASSLIPRNGIDTLISAMAQLDDPTLYQLNIAGDGPLLSELKNLTNTLKLEKQVNFLGRVPNSKIPKLLSDSDIFVRPSRWEGFGVAFIEAMSYRLPVIATPVGGIPDFISHNQTGILVQPDNPSQLASAIQQVSSNPKLRKKLANNAYNLVSKKYTWDQIALKVDNHLQSLTDGAKR